MRPGRTRIRGGSGGKGNPRLGNLESGALAKLKVTLVSQGIHYAHFNCFPYDALWFVDVRAVSKLTFSLQFQEFNIETWNILRLYVPEVKLTNTRKVPNKPAATQSYQFGMRSGMTPLSSG